MDLIQSLRKVGLDLAVFFVAYTLTPHARHPTQLKQCVEAVEYILTQTDCAPENVYLGGDSAGANAALAVLLHISHHPHPSYTNHPASPLGPDSCLGGVVCLGPWVDFDFDQPSEHANRGRDCVSQKSERAWADSYRGNNPSDAWSEPTLAPVEWWKDVRVREFLVLVGSDEVLLSGIGKFVDKVQVCYFCLGNYLSFFTLMQL